MDEPEKKKFPVWYKAEVTYRMLRKRTSHYVETNIAHQIQQAATENA